MKKVLFVLVILTILSWRCNYGVKYDSWKDTKESFGDGTYQIFRGVSDSSEEELCLYNCKRDQGVISEIDGYKKRNNYVWFVGSYMNQKVFCKLNIKKNLLLYYSEGSGADFFMASLDDMLSDGQIKLYSSPDKFSEEDREEFEKLEIK